MKKEGFKWEDRWKGLKKRWGFKLRRLWVEGKIKMDLMEEKSDKRLKERGNKCKKFDRVSWFCLCKTRGELGRKKVRKGEGEDVGSLWGLFYEGVVIRV